MKDIRYSIVIAMLLISTSATSQQFVPVNGQSTVEFTISNLGFDVTGTFGGLQGSVWFDEKNLGSSSVNVTVDAASVDTDNSTRDKHLRGADYFNVKTYPQIRLSSVKIARSATPGYYVLFAKLTVKDTIKDISFPFTATPEAGAYRFKGEFSIKRRDFDVGGKNTISNDLKVKLNVLTKK